MSLAEAREKLRELIKMVSAAETKTIRDIIEMFNKFYEDHSYRTILMWAIRTAVIQSLTEVFNHMKYRVRSALKLFDSFISQYYIYYYDIAERGDISRLVEFLGKAVEVLKSDDEYREAVEDIWVDLQEVLKEVIGR